MKFDDNCVFCKIVQKQAPSSVVYEDDFVMAFLDIRPACEGHTLVVSKEHFEGILDIPGELLGKVYQVSKVVAKAVVRALDADGVSVIQQNGRAANQVVFHLHVHVIPRHCGQKMKVDQELQTVGYNQLDLTAAKIKAHI
ncbi:MAG: HIT family protein [Candidatus Bathyarchaeota archaeon]|nr:HIT family protein [Candidatus Termiticorpusculum sp.]